MIKCPNCGNDAPESARSCVVCATPLPRPSVATAVLTPPVPSRPGTTTDAETVAVPFVNPFTTGSGSTSLVPGQTFGQRYQIISLLGVGGMGAVYHVWDSELALSLALKVIKPDSDPLATQELERRFKRELVLARQVTHTNVIRIHDMGEIDGIKYITMPFVHGTDLARLLSTEGKLPIARALPLARQMVSGLRAAHEVGIVHRDLKPANILIDDSEKAVLTDFGIARSTHAGTFATAAGAIIGTLAYMAPEQATGRPVDQRADIYAFGLILSEMLVGKRGSSGGDTALALLIERSSHAPPPLRTVDPSIPEPLDRLVARCLEPDPAARYQTTKDLEDALERLDAEGHERLKPVVVPPKPGARWPGVAAAIALGLAIGLGWVFLGPRTSGPPPVAVAHEPVSVLIADFDNQAKDPVFTGSLEQALNIAVEGASFITSYSRASAQQLVRTLNPGASLDAGAARLVAEREGIRYVLTGAIATKGSGYTLTVTAIDPANGNELAKAVQDVANKSQVLDGIGNAASKLRDALGDKTPESVRRAAGETVTTKSLDALQNYSMAQDLSSAGKQEESIPYYQKAIEFDPDFGRAYSGWATALYNTGHSPEAKEQWQKALPLMDRMTEREKYRTLGAWFLGAGADYEKAIENYEKLVAAYPADRAGQTNLALAYFQTLDFAKAMDHGRQAVTLYPKNTRSRQNLALYAMYAGDLKTAESEARLVLEQSKGQYKAYLPLAAVAFASADFTGMRQAYEGMRSSSTTGASLAVQGLADLAMYQGRWAEAQQLLETGIAEDVKTKAPLAQAAKLTALAEVHLALGHVPQAVQAAQGALAIARDDSSTLVSSALVFVRAGRRAEAQAIAQNLSQQFQRRSRAYGTIVEGEIARAAGRRVDALDAFGATRKHADLWLARLLLGLTNVEAARYVNAQAELELAEKRRGEAFAIFLDDVPSFRYLVYLPYWLARSQEGMSASAPAVENYKKFLSLRPDESRDPLVTDARKRLAALSSAR
jgi:eukaryotic-like serine/threonine-protein kinase